uniref:Taste receptor type 2 n=1 Tax=Hippopotamus amphibius TaxID=9833 RepID=A0A0A7JTC9_HIPAM|nr:taste receptor type 2 member 1 [Hippopotamus amphibius]
MLEPHLIIHLLLAMIQFLTGVLVNGIIMVVNGMDLIKQKKMIPLNLLISCLAISRICLQLAVFSIDLAFLSLIEFPPLTEKFAVLTFVNDLGLWLATWLSVFYCARIAPVAHPLFFLLKMKISKLVPWLILGSLLYASSSAFFHSKNRWAFSKEDFLGLLSPNATTQFKDIPALQFAFLFVEHSLPLLIFLISSLLLLFYLGRHTWQMRNTATGPRTPHMRVYINTLLSILSFLVLYLCHYMTSALLFYRIFNLRSFIFLFLIFMVGSYQSGHSITLILGNPKMKQNAKKLLLPRKCCQ